MENQEMKTVPEPKPKIKRKKAQPKVLRVNQVADRLNVVPSTIYLWCDHGHLEKVVLSDKVMRITEESVDELIKKGLAKGQD